MSIIEITYLADRTATTSATFTITTDGEFDVMYAPTLAVHLVNVAKMDLLEAANALNAAKADGSYTIVLV